MLWAAMQVGLGSGVGLGLGSGDFVVVRESGLDAHVSVRRRDQATLDR